MDSLDKKRKKHLTIFLVLLIIAIIAFIGGGFSWYYIGWAWGGMYIIILAWSIGLLCLVFAIIQYSKYKKSNKIDD